MAESIAYQNYKDVMKSLGFFGSVVSAKYIKFWDEHLNEGERSVFLESASMPSHYPNRPFVSYSAENQQRLVRQINRAIAWADNLKGVLL